MEKVRQNGYYAVFNKKTYRIDRSNLTYFLNKYPDNEWVLWGNNEEFPVDKELIKSAYKLEIIAEVDGFECPIGGLDKNGFYLFTRGKGADEHFKMVLGHGATDRFYRKDEEIENIWEVRTPIEGFPFKTEKIVYLKMYGQWLDKPM